MGIFSFFEKRKPLIVEDEVFGTLQEIRIRGISTHYFEGKGMFRPLNREIEYSVACEKKSGPVEEQRQFYEWVQNNYSGLKAKMTPLLEKELRNWKDDFRIVNFDAQFFLEYLTIPSFGATPLLWDMSFRFSENTELGYVVDFTDLEPTSAETNDPGL